MIREAQIIISRSYDTAFFDIFSPNVAHQVSHSAWIAQCDAVTRIVTKVGILSAFEGAQYLVFAAAPLSANRKKIQSRVSDTKWLWRDQQNGYLNPYRQIPETFSKKRAMTQGIFRKLFPDFFQILQFWGATQGIFLKLFPGKFHEYLPMKKYFFPKTGHDSEAFPENRFWKNYPENPLSHSPDFSIQSALNSNIFIR